MTAMHPDIERLAFLLGTWTGRGNGDYPTIDAFEYEETVVFGHAGKPFVSYTQRTRGKDGPLHAEAGYIRPAGDHDLELIIAQPTGIAEVHTGRQTGNRIEFSSEWVGRSPTAKRVDRVWRMMSVDGSAMRNELRMAAVGQPFQWHLGADLERVS